MHPILIEIQERLGVTNITPQQSIHLLNEYGKAIVAKHTEQVAIEGKRLAVLFEEDIRRVEIACLLHDISAVIPDEKRIEVAEAFNLDILLEERIFPLIVHQKLSREIAKNLFGITNESILSAICCHSTLKANPSKLDMILFIADKLMWDQGGMPPYYDLVQEGLAKSLEHGVFAFARYMYENKSSLKVLHPWLVDAYNYLSMRLGYELNIM